MSGDPDLDGLTRELRPGEFDRLPEVPEQPVFLRGCIRYRQSVDDSFPSAPRSDEPYPQE